MSDVEPRGCAGCVLTSLAGSLAPQWPAHLPSHKTLQRTGPNFKSKTIDTFDDSMILLIPNYGPCDKAYPLDFTVSV